MATFCTYIPSKGESLFKELRKQYDYPVARKVFLRAIHPQFIQDYRNTLTLDSEGVPTLESLMNNVIQLENALKGPQNNIYGNLINNNQM